MLYYKSASIQKKGYTEPLIQTQIESINKQLLVDLNWLAKGIWKLIKSLKGVLLCKISFQKARHVYEVINNIKDPFNKHLLCQFLPLYYQRPGTCDIENAIVNVEAIGVVFKELKNCL